MIQESRKLADQFVYPGYIQSVDMPAILSMAELMLYPSLRESFGIPILEGMACGTPVLTSYAASMPEVSGEAALLVNPESVDEISTGIKRLINDSDLRSDLREKGLERAKNFSWRNTAVEVLKLYTDLNTMP